MLIKTFGFAEGSSPDLSRHEKFNEINDGFRSVLDNFSRKNTIISRKKDNSPTFDSETLFWEYAKISVKG